MSNPRDVLVEVIIDDPNSDPPKFHFETTDLPMDPDNHLHFKNCGHPGFHIHYHLKNPPNNYFFPRNSKKDKALASQEGLGCPAQDSGQWDDFKALRVEPDRLTLIVHNKNSKQAQFGYALSVTNDDGANHLRLDPGGTNSNGPSRLNSDYLTIGAIGATIGILSAITTAAVLRFTNTVTCPDVAG